MPELRLVVLALQDRIAYGPNFEHALGAVFGRVPSALSLDAAPSGQPSVVPRSPGQTPAPQAQPAAPPSDASVEQLISEAARDLAEYQRLTAEGRLGEAGLRLEALKQKLDRLNQRR